MGAESVLEAQVLAQIEAVLERAYPAEGCGIVVVGGDGAVRVAASENLTEAMRAAQPELYTRGAENGYVLDGRLIVEAERRGEQLVAIFHSHPDVGAYFSAEDVARALVDWGDGPEPAYPGVDYLVTAVDAGRASESKLFRWDGAQFAEVARYGRAGASG